MNTDPLYYSDTNFLSISSKHVNFQNNKKHVISGHFGPCLLTYAKYVYAIQFI